MTHTLNLKKRKRKGLREIIVVISAIILTTIGIKASDMIFDSQGQPALVVVDGCPADMTRVISSLGDFCIDRYEVSAGNDCPIKDPGNQSDTRFNLNANTCWPISEAGHVPWRYISQDQAAQACARAGKRLPTPKEWYEAALSTPDLAANWSQDDCQVANNWSQQPGLSGTGKNCVSAAGAYDMIGNVWEWVEGAISEGNWDGRELPGPGYIDSSDGASMPAATNQDAANENYNLDYFWVKKTGIRAMARGGYWDNNSDAGQYSLYIVMPPSGVGAGIGFRCVK